MFNSRFETSQLPISIRHVFRFVTIVASIGFANPAIPDEPLIFQGHAAWVTQVVFTPDSTAFYSASQDGTVRLWDVQGQVELGMIDEYGKKPVKALTLTSNGHTLAIGGSGGQIVVWDILADRSLHIIENGIEIDKLYFTRDGKELFASGSDSPHIQVWNTATGMMSARHGVPYDKDRLTRWIGQRVSGFVISADGKILVSARHSYPVGAGSIVHVKNIQTGETVAHAMTTASELLFVRDQMIVFARNDNAGEADHIRGDAQIVLMNSTTGHEIGHLIAFRQGRIKSLTISPDRRVIAAAGIDAKGKPSLKLLDAALGRIFDDLRPSDYLSSTLTFSPDGRYLAGGFGKSIYVWQIQPIIQSGLMALDANDAKSAWRRQ